MKKNKLFGTQSRALFAIALVALIGFSFAACDNGSSSSAKPLDKDITITGITPTGDWVIMLIEDLYTFANSDGTDGMSAVSVGTVSGGSVSFDMYSDVKLSRTWSGNGLFHIFLFSDRTEDVYLYTNGNALDTESLGSIPKYGITNAKASYTIPFSLFKLVVTETQKPNAPMGLVTTGATVNSISLSWSSFGGTTGFYVYRNSSPTGSYSYVGNSSGTSFTDTGLTANTTYYYKVSAYNKSGEGPQSDYVFAVTLSNTTNYIIVSGTPRVGQTLTATSFGTGWGTYFWGYADKSDANRYTIISGATGSTYTVSSTYAGRYIRAFRFHPDGDWHTTTTNQANFPSNFIGPMQQ